MLRAAALFAACLLCAELVARSRISGSVDFLVRSDDPRLGYTLRPGVYETDGYFLRTPLVEYRIGAEGCRTNVRTQAGDDVLFVGSSLMFGSGVTESSSIPRLVSASLARRGHAIGALNCAIPGYNVEQTLQAAAQQITRFGPRLVVVLVSAAHMRAPFDWSNVAPRSTSVRWLTKHSRLARLLFLVHLVRKYDHFALGPMSDAALDRGFRELRAAIAPRDTHVLFFACQLPRDVRPDLRARVTGTDMTLHELGAPPRSPEYFLADHEHWNLRGNRFVAEQMIPTLEAALSRTPR